MQQGGKEGEDTHTQKEIVFVCVCALFTCQNLNYIYLLQSRAQWPLSPHLKQSDSFSLRAPLAFSTTMLIPSIFYNNMNICKMNKDG